MKKRNLYLNNISVKKALNSIFNYLIKKKIHLDSEIISVSNAKGRIISKKIIAKNFCPSFLSSAMDGIVTSHKYIKEAKDTNPVILKKNQYAEIDTGDKIPCKYDCVIPAEEIIYLKNEKIKLFRSHSLWDNIRQIGEDVEKQELIILKNHCLTSYDLGLLLNGGITEVLVFKKPIIAIIPTGDEIIDPFDKNNEKKENKIIDCNTTMLKSLLKDEGAEVIKFSIIKDNKILLKKTIEKAIKISDIIIIIAGSSAGRQDYTEELIREMGEVFFHGVAIKPGKPTLAGAIKEKIILGIPGFPVAAIFSLEIFAFKIIEYLFKKKARKHSKIKAILSDKITSQVGILELIRVIIGKIYGKYKIIVLPRGAGSISTLAKADGIIKIPVLSQGYEKDKKIKVKLFKNKNIFKKRLIIQGSHDFSIDILKNMFAELNNNYELIENNIGSLSGIISVNNKNSHLAGIHLFDSKNNNYNFSFVNKYLGEKGCLIHVAKRTQGLIIAKNNPLKIKKIEDIIDLKARFINRQNGSGTRLLLDYLININKMSKNKINGYENIVYNHLEIGNKIINNQADVGLGISTVANIYNLDFIPISEESYDFCFLYEFFDSILFKMLENMLSSKKFKQKIKIYGGYNTYDTGKIFKNKK